MDKVYEAGFPDNMNAMDDLTQLERRRINIAIAAYRGDYANLFYQYQHGYLDEEYYKDTIEGAIRMLAPWWRKAGSNERPSFKKEVDRILSSD